MSENPPIVDDPGSPKQPAPCRGVPLHVHRGRLSLPRGDEVPVATARVDDRPRRTAVVPVLFLLITPPIVRENPPIVDNPGSPKQPAPGRGVPLLVDRGRLALPPGDDAPVAAAWVDDGPRRAAVAPVVVHYVPSAVDLGGAPARQGKQVVLLVRVIERHLGGNSIHFINIT